MIDKKFLAVTVGAIFVLGMYGPNVAEIIQSAEAHGVQAQLQSRFIQITNVKPVLYDSTATTSKNNCGQFRHRSCFLLQLWCRGKRRGLQSCS